jgi:hypothetical protein
MKTTKVSSYYPIYEKGPRVCLNIPHTLELVETVEPLELIMYPNRFPYLCGDHMTVFREISIIKPLDKLAKLRDNWGELI